MYFVGNCRKRSPKSRLLCPWSEKGGKSLHRQVSVTDCQRLDLGLSFTTIPKPPTISANIPHYRSVKSCEPRAARPSLASGRNSGQQSLDKAEHTAPSRSTWLDKEAPP